MSKRRARSRTTTDQVHSITSTQTPLGEDIDRRARRYLVQMALRTACFVGAVLTWGRVPTWLSVSLLVGAVILPYVAVVLANAGRERPEHADSPLELREIGAAPLPRPGGASDPFVPDPFAPGSFTGRFSGSSTAGPSASPHGATGSSGPGGTGRD